MTERHAQIVRRLTDLYQASSGTVAIALFGSLAKGTGPARSDVDLEVITSEAGTWSLEKVLRMGLRLTLSSARSRSFRIKSAPCHS